MNDSEIVEGLFAREEAALEALRARYGGRCMALLSPSVTYPRNRALKMRFNT